MVCSQFSWWYTWLSDVKNRTPSLKDGNPSISLVSFYLQQSFVFKIKMWKLNILLFLANLFTIKSLPHITTMKKQDYRKLKYFVHPVTFYTLVWKTGRIMNRGMASVRLYVNFFVSGELLLQFTSDQAETWYIIRPWCGAAHIVSGLQSTKCL